MKIVIMAVVAVALTLLAFLIADRKGKKESEAGSPSTRDVRSHRAAKQQVQGGPIEYSIYIMSNKERVLYILAAAVGLFIVAYVFYKNIVIALIVSLLGFYYPRLRSQQLMVRRKDQLTGQFKQALYSLGSALSAGRSMENAFKAVVDDLKLLYSDPKTLIIQEFELINRRVDNGEPIEIPLQEFARRADIDDITNFVDVFVTCKRTGGDLADVIRRTSTIISDKLQTQQDISIMLAQKRFEAKALMVAPVGMVALLSWSSPDYMAPLYTLGLGTLIMTGALIILGAVAWGIQKIIDIEV